MLANGFCGLSISLIVSLKNELKWSLSNCYANLNLAYGRLYLIALRCITLGHQRMKAEEVVRTSYYQTAIHLHVVLKHFDMSVSVT